MLTSLPKLPGYSIPNVGQDRFPRTKFFDFKQGTQFYDPSRHYQTHGTVTPGMYFSPLKSNSNKISTVDVTASGSPVNRSKSSMGFRDNNNSNNNGVMSRTPSRAATSLGFAPSPNNGSVDKDSSEVVLFRAFFREDLPDQVSQEPYRIHDCVLSCFFNDNCFTVCERAGKNSGLWPGVILRRQAVLNEHGQHKYPWQLLRVGDTLEMFGRDYHIVDCDERSRNKYMDLLQVTQPPALPVPNDPYHEKMMAETEHNLTQQRAKDTVIARKLQKQNDMMTRFLNFDRQVLRFYCIWDDTTHQFGDRRFFIMHLYLTDMTIEIKEMVGRNSGRKTTGVFLARGLLPREGRHVERSDELEEEDCYMDHNLRIGKTINVFGKPFLLYDCDEFTRRYYETFYGLADFEPIDVSVEIPSLPSNPTPRHNGFGQELDTYANTKRLMPKRMRGDLKRWRKYAGTILRFQGKWDDATDPYDKTRIFVFTYFMDDNTCAIFESTGLNSKKKVQIPSKFLQKSALKKPNNNGSLPQFYGLEDFYVGSRIHVHGRTFLLTEIDAHSQHLLEQLGLRRPNSRQQGSRPVSRERVEHQLDMDRMIVDSRPGSRN